MKSKCESLRAFDRLSSSPLLLKPYLLMTASSSSSLNTRGFSFPGCSSGQTLPISTKPNPMLCKPWMPSPSLSKPAAIPRGFFSLIPQICVSCKVNLHEPQLWVDSNIRVSSPVSLGPHICLLAKDSICKQREQLCALFQPPSIVSSMASQYYRRISHRSCSNKSPRKAAHCMSRLSPSTWSSWWIWPMTSWISVTPALFLFTRNHKFSRTQAVFTRHQLFLNKGCATANLLTIQTFFLRRLVIYRSSSTLLFVFIVFFVITSFASRCPWIFPISLGITSSVRLRWLAREHVEMGSSFSLFSRAQNIYDKLSRKRKIVQRPEEDDASDNEPAIKRFGIRFCYRSVSGELISGNLVLGFVTTTTTTTA